MGSTSLIFRLYHGRSPANGDLVELGKALGMRGPEIGEPGTPLT